MLLRDHNAPHIRARETNRSMMADVIIALLPLYLMAFYFYGTRALLLGATGVFTCVVSDMLCVILRGQRVNPRDFSPVVTGMLIPLLLPATVPFRLVVIGGIFAMVFVKHPFGGTGQNLFNPAAAAFALLAISWSDQIFLYPQPLSDLSALESLRLVEGPARTMALGGLPVFNVLDLLTGNFAGPMGATNTLVLLTCLMYLIFRRTVSWQTPISFLLTAALIAFFFPRVETSGLNSVVLELCSGTLLLGAVFFLPEPVTSPKRGLAKYFYGITAAVVTMLFRRFGGFEETVMFAILLMNAFVPALDRLSEYILRALRRIELEPKKRAKPVRKPQKEST